MYLTIASIPLDLSPSDDRTKRLIAEAWPEFAEFEGRGPRVRVTATADPAVLERGVTNDEPVVRADGERWTIDRLDYHAELDRDRLALDVRYGGELPFLSSCLRVALSLFLARRGGVLVHASSTRAADGVVLCPGQSGAGKTTIAMLGAPRPVLSDEISALVHDDECSTVHPTPFWGEMVRKRAAGPGRLAALVFPERSAAPGLSPLSPGEATLRMLGSTLAFTSELIYTREVLAAVIRTLEWTRPHLLSYSLPDNPWPMLESLASSEPLRSSASANMESRE